MAIDRTGKYWKGSQLSDLHEYLDVAAVFEKLLHLICSCGSQQFHLKADSEQGCAQATCAGCGIARQLRKSVQQRKSAELRNVECPCGGDRFEIVVGTDTVVNVQYEPELNVTFVEG